MTDKEDGNHMDGMLDRLWEIVSRSMTVQKSVKVKFVTADGHYSIENRPWPLKCEYWFAVKQAVRIALSSEECERLVIPKRLYRYHRRDDDGCYIFMEVV